jgi:hypothetical protein
MKRNTREREHELQFASVLDTDTGGLLRLMRPVFRRIVRRAVYIHSFSFSKNIDFLLIKNADGEQTDDDDDDDDDGDEDDDEEVTGRSRHVYSFDCAPS